jgi:hypothetical protein
MKKHIFILGIFVLLTFLMLHPLPLKMGNSLVDFGDSILNTWIMSWDIHKIPTNIKDFFDANIFYPHKRTLAYSEHLFASSLLALPIWLISKNMVFGFNFILLFSFVICGYGTYLLTYELTKNRLAGFIAGIIFAFCPFRFSRLYHLQVLTAQWIPFAFLYLLRFFRDPRWKHLLLFSLFFVLQALSCGYYALFLSLFVGITIIYFLALKKELRQVNVINKIIVSLVVCFLIILPFFYPYIEVRKEMGFHRSLSEATDLSAYGVSYLAAPPNNLLWSKITKTFGKPEGYLFPGIMALFLSIFGLWKAPRHALPKKKLYWKFNLAILGLFAFYTALFLLSDIKKAGMLTHTLLIYPLFLLIITRIVIDRRIRQLTTEHLFFLVLTFFGIVFSLGPVIHIGTKSLCYGPYHILYSFFPGFDGIRVVSRLAIMAMLGIGVLAGYGVKKLANRGNTKILAVIIPLLILGEYFSKVPLNATGDERAQINLNNPPQVYRWLGDQEGNFAILELPCPNLWYDYMYMYYSTYHWKSLVNGHSGYDHPEYSIMRQLFENFPTEYAIELFKKLGIEPIKMKLQDGRLVTIKSRDRPVAGLKYIIFHTDHYTLDEWQEKERKLRDFSSLFFIRKVGPAYVYELKR